MNEPPSRFFTTAAWWAFCAPYRARAALLRGLDATRPLVPESAAVAMAAGGVAIAAEGAWPLLALYAAACGLSAAVARVNARRRR